MALASPFIPSFANVSYYLSRISRKGNKLDRRPIVKPLSQRLVGFVQGSAGGLEVK